MSGWYMIGRRRMKVMHIRRIVVKMVIALFISERSLFEPAATAIGAKTVAISVNQGSSPSSDRVQHAQHTMVVARARGMIAK